MDLSLSKSIWKAIDGVETAHLHRELYEKNLDVENIPHISIVRDPLERYISLKSYICHPQRDGLDLKLITFQIRLMFGILRMDLVMIFLIGWVPY